MGHFSRFGTRKIYIAPDEREQISACNRQLLKQRFTVQLGKPEAIKANGYRAWGRTETLLPGLSCWAGLITTEDACSAHSDAHAACAFEQNAHTEEPHTHGDFYREINKITRIWRQGVIRPYGRPYDLMTPDTSSDTAPPTNSTPDATASPHLTIGFDAEWCEGAQGRQLLSYQLAVPVHDAAHLWFVVVYQIADGCSTRYSLGRLLGHFLRVADACSVLGFRLPAFRTRRQKAKISGPKKSRRGDRKSPLTITLAGHYSVIDITILHKGAELLRQLDTVHGTEVSVQRPVTLDLIDHQRHGLSAIVYLRDSLTLAEDKTPLAALGQALDLPKVDLPPEFNKSCMDEFRRACPNKFVVYAAVDAIITLEWSERISQFVQKYIPPQQSKIIPPTLGSLSASLSRSMIMQKCGYTTQKEFDAGWRGLSTIYEQTVSPKTGRPRSQKCLVPSPQLALTESSWREAFYGGRNECFAYGPHLPKLSDCWFDWDVKNAYVAAMALVRDIDWSMDPLPITPGPLCLGTLSPCDYFVGRIRFKFPGATKFPCIPLKDANSRGLIFPLEGEAFATAPEICLALQMGARIDVLSGHVHPVRKGNGSLLIPVTTFITERENAKKSFGKKSIQELLWKQIGNGVFGKLGQGLKGKRNYSTRSNSVENVPPSSITCAPYAALVTALVRALVSATIADLCARGFTVLSVTTDGLLTDADEAGLAKIDAFGFVPLFANARAEATGEHGSIWECKHAAKEMVTIRTRVGFGIGKVADYELPCAAAGYVMQGEDKNLISSGEELAEVLAKKFASQGQNLHFSFTRLPSPRDYIQHGADGLSETATSRVNWTFDFKRVPDPDTIEEGSIFGVPCVRFLTEPHQSLAEFQTMRSDHDKNQPKLRKAEQVLDFMVRHGAKKAACTTGARRASPESGGMRRTAAVNILRGIRGGVIHITVPSSGPVVLPIISRALNISLTKNDWKNAARRAPCYILPKVMAPRLVLAAAELGVVDWVIWADQINDCASS